MHATQPAAQPQSGLTWGRLVVITLVSMVIGVAAGVGITTSAGLFAPPLLPLTVPFFLLLWLPVFIVGLLLRPRGSRQPLLTLIVLGVLILVGGLALLGPAVGYSVHPCQSVPLPDQPVRYECETLTYQGTVTRFVLLGSPGSPFVRPSQSINPDS